MKWLFIFCAYAFVMLPFASVSAQDCIPSRLTVGITAQVTPGNANNLRDQPSADGNRIGQIPAEATFTVLEGPVCDAQGRAWWQVEYNGSIGWTVEGQGDEYYVEPVEVQGETSPSLTPVEPTTIDCSALPARLTIARQGRVLEGEPLAMRARPNVTGISAEIPAGGIFTVVDAPNCDSSNRAWWLVTYADTEGWILEGMAGTYFVEPVIEASETLVMQPRFRCLDGLPTRLFSGGLGRVIPGGANRLRSTPSTDGEILGVIPSQAVFGVNNAMQCDDSGTLWRHIEYNSLSGWTAEVVNGAYTVEPSSGGGIVPDEREVITPDTLWQVTELARFLPELSRSDNSGFTYGIAVTWSPDSSQVALTDTAGVVVYDGLSATSRRFRSNMAVGVYPPMFNAAFSPDGSLLAAGSADGIAYVWDVESGAQLAALQHEDDYYVSTVAFSPDGRWLATGSVYSSQHIKENNQVILWDATTFEQVRTLPDFAYTFVHDRLTFSPDSQTLLIAGNEGNFRLVDVATGEVQQTVNSAPMVFSADGAMLLAGSTLYDRGTVVRSLPLAILTDADFHPSGTMFLTASIEVGGPSVDDRGLRLWDGRLGTPLLTIRQDGISSAAFSPDGTLIAVLTYSGLSLYGIPTS